jgi:hypothetical protein
MYLLPTPCRKSQIASCTFLISAFCFLFFFSLNCAAQTETAPPPKSLQKEMPTKKQRPTFTAGGGIGFQFGTYNSVEVMPMGGVYIKPWLVALVNAQYSYMWYRNHYNSHIWGIGVALEPWIVKRIVIHAGYEYNQMIFKWLDGSPKQIQDFHFAVVGAGYKQYLSKNIYFQGLILFNIPLNQPTIQNYAYSYYPYFRVVVGVDL